LTIDYLLLTIERKVDCRTQNTGHTEHRIQETGDRISTAGIGESGYQGVGIRKSGYRIGQQRDEGRRRDEEIAAARFAGPAMTLWRIVGIWLAFGG